MATMPGADLRLLPAGVNHSAGGMGAIRGVVIHVIVGSLSAADGAFHNPRWKASAHFGVGKDGHIIQWVNTADRAWAEMAGNPEWISVETEGQPTEYLTDAQLDACARVVKWAHDNHGQFPLQIANSPRDYGIGTHEMGGAAWGGHACPGTLRASQRSEIIRRASGAAPAPTPAPPLKEDDMPRMIQCRPDGPFGNPTKSNSGWFVASFDRGGPYKWKVGSGRFADALAELGEISNTERDAQGHIRPTLQDESVFDAFLTVG